MCRWLVYKGEPIFLSKLLLEPGHSLLDQALNAREIEWPTNADGFGVGWYDKHPAPGVFRDVLPIWNDINLRQIAEQVASPLFFAHIRKATGGEIQRTNCHPFSRGHWLFQHNGSIPSFSAVKQRLYARINPEHFASLKGSTDSECMFLLALTEGLDHDPPGAIRRMIEIIEDVRQEAGLDRPFRCTSSFSDGDRIWAVRYSTHGEPRTLYYSTSPHALCDFEGCTTELPQRSVIIASEPLGTVGEHWTRVEPASLLTVDADGIRTEPLGVGAAAAARD
jgi:glutamine amidotransferase